MLQICENIRQARKERKISQDFMAGKLGIPRSTYQNWENTIEPDLKSIKAIAQILDMPAYELLKGVIDFNPDSAENKRKIAKAGPLALMINPEDVDKLKDSLKILSTALEKPIELDKKYSDLGEHFSHRGVNIAAEQDHQFEGGKEKKGKKQ